MSDDGDFSAYASARWSALVTEPRGVVGFEGVLGALLAALDGGVVTSIHGVVK